MKSKKRNLNGGSYDDKVNVMRSCTQYVNVPSNGNESKCRCVKKGQSFKYDNRLFECSESGFSLLDSSQVNSRFKDLVDKILEFDETYQRYESRQEFIDAVDKYINREYRILGLSVETKLFIREFILDDFKFRRRFKGEYGSKNVEILIKNLDKIKRRIKNKKNSQNFTLKNLRDELKLIVKTLENHVSNVNRLIKNDKLEQQLKGDPYEFSGTREDLKKLLSKHVNGTNKLSNEELTKRCQEAFNYLIKEITDNIYEFTESQSIKIATISKLKNEFGNTTERQLKFFLKYNNDPSLLYEFSVKFLKTIMDKNGAEDYKKFVSRKRLIKFIKLNVGYDYKFSRGTEKSVDKYFEGKQVSDIAYTIKRYKTLNNFFSKEYKVLESMAGHGMKTKLTRKTSRK